MATYRPHRVHLLPVNMDWLRGIDEGLEDLQDLLTGFLALEEDGRETVPRPGRE
ncbi:MAG: hypothetical protein ACOC8K_03165 [Gemmatimonadota bacterium]